MQQPPACIPIAEARGIRQDGGW